MRPSALPGSAVWAAGLRYGAIAVFALLRAGNPGRYPGGLPIGCKRDRSLSEGCVYGHCPGGGAFGRGDPGAANLPQKLLAAKQKPFIPGFERCGRMPFCDRSAALRGSVYICFFDDQGLCPAKRPMIRTVSEG